MTVENIILLVVFSTVVGLLGRYFYVRIRRTLASLDSADGNQTICDDCPTGCYIKTPPPDDGKRRLPVFQRPNKRQVPPNCPLRR